MLELRDALAGPQRLSPEQIVRSDRDLKTIFLVQQFTSNFQGALPVITAGYAVEAYCGGTVTRLHSDVDVHITGLAVADRAVFIDRLENALRSEKAHTKWALQKNSNLGWGQEVVFVENELKKEWSDRRRLELKLKHYLEETQDKFLIDSQENRLEVKVLELHRLIARKIKTFMESAGKTTGRLSGPQDTAELRRLTALEGFNMDKAIDRIVALYEKEEGIESRKAKDRALSEWVKIFG